MNQQQQQSDQLPSDGSTDMSRIFTDVFQMTQVPGGAEMLKKWSDELYEFNQRRMADLTLPIPPSVQSKMDAVMVATGGQDAWKQVAAAFIEMFRAFSSQGE